MILWYQQARVTEFGLRGVTDSNEDFFADAFFDRDVSSSLFLYHFA